MINIQKVKQNIHSIETNAFLCSHMEQADFQWRADKLKEFSSSAPHDRPIRIIKEQSSMPNFPSSCEALMDYYQELQLEHAGQLPSIDWPSVLMSDCLSNKIEVFLRSGFNSATEILEKYFLDDPLIFESESHPDDEEWNKEVARIRQSGQAIVADIERIPFEAWLASVRMGIAFNKSNQCLLSGDLEGSVKWYAKSQGFLHQSNVYRDEALIKNILSSEPGTMIVLERGAAHLHTLKSAAARCGLQLNIDAKLDAIHQLDPFISKPGFWKIEFPSGEITAEQRAAAARDLITSLIRSYINFEGNYSYACPGAKELAKIPDTRMAKWASEIPKRLGENAAFDISKVLYSTIEWLALSEDAGQAVSLWRVLQV